MQESEAFPEPLWTPSTKAEIGDHDENIHPSKAAGIIGEKHASEMAKISVELYTKARDYAQEHGIIIADTKFEFGVDENDNLYLIDEVLTPGNEKPFSCQNKSKHTKSCPTQTPMFYLGSRS